MFKWARNSSSQKFITQKTVPFENVYNYQYNVHIKEKMMSDSGSESSQAT